MPVAMAEPIETARTWIRKSAHCWENWGAQLAPNGMTPKSNSSNWGRKCFRSFRPPELLPTLSVREAVGRIRFELEQTAAHESVLPSRITLAANESVEAALNRNHQADWKSAGWTFAGQRAIQRAHRCRCEVCVLLAAARRSGSAPPLALRIRFVRSPVEAHATRQPVFNFRIGGCLRRCVSRAGAFLPSEVCRGSAAPAIKKPAKSPADSPMTGCTSRCDSCPSRGCVLISAIRDQ